MSKTILVRGGRVVLPNGEAQTNLLLRDGKIVAVDASQRSAADEVIEAEGLIVLPGVIDDQVHFREPGLTHKEDLTTGSAAAAAGGVTTYLEMPNTNPPATDQAAIEWKYQRAAEVSQVNYGFYIGATESNVSELAAAQNVPGIKIFIGSSTGSLLVDDQLALERIFAETTLPICAHCEDETLVRQNRTRLGDQLSVADHSRIRDVEAAVVATSRALDLARRHQHRFHVLHVSTAAELPLLIDAAPYITAEVCLHHLFFSTDDYARLGTLVQMNPSLKSPRDTALLWQGLLSNRIQVIATDHAPHTLEEKSRPYPQSPSGLPAVENSLPLMLHQVHQGKCSLEQLAHWMSDAPARVWGLVGKGRIEVGYDADLVLVDPTLSRTITNESQFAKSRGSPWAGQALTGWPVRTVVGGVTAFLNGRLVDGVRGSRVRCDHARGGYWSTQSGIGT
ncbi:MAG: dihydroorotase [Pirellulaceae bacterium]|nr:dihydroorotase [Pirellulaceae bacterium]